MSVIQIGAVKTLPEYERADKAQAVKVLEEAAEVFAAWQNLDYAWQNLDTAETYSCYEDQTIARTDLVFECADVIITVCHLLAGLGVVDVEGVIADKLRVVESRSSREGDAR